MAGWPAARLPESLAIAVAHARHDFVMARTRHHAASRQTSHTRIGYPINNFRGREPTYPAEWSRGPCSLAFAWHADAMPGYAC